MMVSEYAKLVTKSGGIGLSDQKKKKKKTSTANC